jgi:hypothetical protein
MLAAGLCHVLGAAAVRTDHELVVHKPASLPAMVTNSSDSNVQTRFMDSPTLSTDTASAATITAAEC